MRIQIGNNVLRNWEPGDATALASYADNPKIAANLRDVFPSPYRIGDAEGFIAFASSQTPSTAFAIATESEAIGGIGLIPGEDIYRLTAELGYWLGEPFWGKGIITSAIIAMCEYGFGELGFNRIYADPFITNTASVRVLEKAGFAFEGRLTSRVVKNGQVLDQLLYARIKSGDS